MAMLSPSTSGRSMSPETIKPIFLIKVFMPLLDGEVRAADGFVFHQTRHGRVPPDLALIDDVGTVREPGRVLEILLREHDGHAHQFERGEWLAAGCVAHVG